MTDKRALRPGEVPPPKRARSFPLAHHEQDAQPDDESVGLDQRSSTLGPEAASSLPGFDSSALPQDKASEASTLTEECLAPDCARTVPLAQQKEVDLPEDESVGLDWRAENMGLYMQNPVPGLDPPGPPEDEAPETSSLAKDSHSSHWDASGSVQDAETHVSPEQESDLHELARESAKTSSGTKVALGDQGNVPNPPSPYLSEGSCDKVAATGEDPLPWSAPPEPFRPPNPYRKGQTFQVHKHKACPPFGENYPGFTGQQFCTWQELRTSTLVELCLAHPPMEGEHKPGRPATHLADY